MAKDERLYARFDIAMDEHPKVMLLSDAAFRTLFEMTFYSRRQLTDGFLAAGIISRKWDAEAIAELQQNDPTKPSLYPFEKNGVAGLMIHDYDKHQTTTADIEAKREAGRKGGLAKAKQTASTPVAPASEVLGQEASTTPTAPLAITETKTETDTKEKNFLSEVATATSRPELIRLLDLLDSEIALNGGNCPSRSKKNLDAVRLLIDRDGRTVAEVDQVIRWSQQDEFWRSNILSMSKLREKFDQLRLAANRRQADGKPTPEQRAMATLSLATDIDMRELSA